MYDLIKRGMIELHFRRWFDSRGNRKIFKVFDDREMRAMKIEM